MTVCERLLRDFKFELPGTAVSELLIDAELVDHTVRTLEHYRELGQRVDVEKARKEADLFAEDFRKEHGVEVFITDEALAALVHEAATEGRSVLQLCEQRFHDYQFGLKLIQKNTRCDRFELPVEAVANPDKFLSDLVVQSYRREAQGRA
jgi:ATP-dependent protease Clp ATPase subunit